ncbi:hypothetical protein [Inquilinus sp.]|jgi:hypothetical protein|uniref:hypothetical protein n=1 Tax=Inquilinus sp. TaxID=1932117 RepID=UPI0037841DFE
MNDMPMMLQSLAGLLRRQVDPKKQLLIMRAAQGMALADYLDHSAKCVRTLLRTPVPHEARAGGDLTEGVVVDLAAARQRRAAGKFGGPVS